MAKLLYNKQIKYFRRVAKFYQNDKRRHIKKAIYIKKKNKNKAGMGNEIFLLGLVKNKLIPVDIYEAVRPVDSM